MGNSSNKQQQDLSPANDCDAIISNNNVGNQSHRISPKDWDPTKYAEKELNALIITINGGNDSYDSLYQSVEQTSADPNQYISVYEVNYKNLPYFYEALVEDNKDKKHDNGMEVFGDIMGDISKLDGENIVVNFECCGSCSDSGFHSFPRDNQFILKLTGLLLERKMTVMFSDFSIKAMIKCWVNDPILGENPFIKLDEFGSSFQLEFNVQDLVNSDFAQLQNVGELCANGKAVVSAPGGTILYSVKPQLLTANSADNQPYALSVLTVVTQAGGKSVPPSLSIGDDRQIKGAAGHVVLKYKNGGTILTSCGHWVSLVKLDTTMEAALNLAEKKYGSEFADQKREEWNKYSNISEQTEQIRLFSNCEVQKAAPCKYKYSKW